MNRCGTAMFDLREGFFFDGSDHDAEPRGACSLENEEWELAVACDEAEFFLAPRHFTVEIERRPRRFHSEAGTRPKRIAVPLPRLAASGNKLSLPSPP